MLQRTPNEALVVSTYRPDIDGLRAVAVLSVMANHYGADWLPGGFTGVDVFFVISGYLITQGLVHDIAVGGNWLGRFYDRRVRRLLPALSIVVVFTLLAGYLFLMPGDFASLGASSSYSAFGLGNLYFYWNTGYFDRESELQPLLHLWSLGVEEQFYLVWPLLLAFLLKLPGKKAPVSAIVAIVACSLYFAQHQLNTNPKAAFYLPYSRAWELAVGAGLAFIPSVRSRQLSALFLGIGLTAVGFSLLFVSAERPFPGLAALPAVLGAALVVLRKEPVRLSALLANRPMVTVGLISYSLYLWHWPVLVIYRHYTSGALPSTSEAIALALVSIILAYLTWRFIEPMRRVRVSMSITLLAGLCMSLTILGFGTVIQKTDGIFTRFPEFARSISSLDEMWKWDACRSNDSVAGFESDHCVFGGKWDQARSRGVLWGDSHAEHFGPLVESLLPKDASVALITPCPAILGEHVRRVWLEQPGYVEQCKTLQDRVVNLINSGSVDWVVIAAAWGTLSSKVSQDGSLPSQLNGIGLIGEGTKELLSRIHKNVKVTILGQVPANVVDPPPCALKLWRRKCEKQGELAAIAAKRFIAPLDEMFIRLTKHYQFQFLSPSSTMCTTVLCDPWFEGQPLYRDTSHLRRNLPISVRKDLAQTIGIDRVF